MKQHIAAVLFSLALAGITATTANAGSLTPPGAPAPTMRTMEELKPSWSKKIPAAQRFELVLDNFAVLDKETGLVWERSASVTDFTWDEMQTKCFKAVIGGRRGWRLPTIDELTSLVDPTQIPALPSGHLFTNVFRSPSYYWSSTILESYPSGAWAVNFYDGSVDIYNKSDFNYVRCVRGGQ